MDYLVRTKNVGELTNKLIIKCTESVLILCKSYWRVGNIIICTRHDVRSLYKYYHLYAVRCQKSLQILPFVHGTMSEVSINITICTRRDVRSLYKCYHLYTARCQKPLQILPFVHDTILEVSKILPFVHDAMSEVSVNITICTWRVVRSLYKYYHFTRRDVRSLYKYYHLYTARCQKSLKLLQFVHSALSDVSINIADGKDRKTAAGQ
jgi:hypothetical protein